MPLGRFASSLALAMSCLLVSPSRLLAESDVPGVGQWKMNVGKSKIGTEIPPRSMTSRIELVDGHASVTGVRISADGIRSEIRFKAKLDGKDYPIQGHPGAETISLKRIDARTVERIDKKAGKVVETSLTVYSEDGKTSVTTGKAKNFRGDEFQYTMVNEKQP